jgi:hypothetical protein
MGVNGVNNFKYTSLSNVQRKLMKNNADDDKNGEDFNAVNGQLRKKRSIEFINTGDTTEEAPKNSLPKTPQVFSEQSTSILSDQKEDSLKRAMLFIDRK